MQRNIRSVCVEILLLLSNGIKNRYLAQRVPLKLLSSLYMAILAIRAECVKAHICRLRVAKRVFVCCVTTARVSRADVCCGTESGNLNITYNGCDQRWLRSAKTHLSALGGNLRKQ